MAMVYYRKFAVHRTPHCMWDREMDERESEFVSYFDPDYLAFVADVFSQLLKDEIELHAAMALRTYYSHALETLFALLCAFIQAPDCISGWFLTYRPTELRDLVQDIQEKREVLTKLDLDPVTWLSLSKLINSIATDDGEMLAEAQQRFASLWARLASDFLDEARVGEFNSIKHGLRVKSGGFDIGFCPRDPAGGPDLKRVYKPMSGSKYGSSFFQRERLPSKHHFRVLKRAVNWDPASLAQDIRLAALSMHNILACLRVIKGADPASEQIRIPGPEYFDCHIPKSGSIVTCVTADVPVPHKELPKFTSEQILAVYEEPRWRVAGSSDEAPEANSTACPEDVGEEGSSGGAS